jgi:hypothetical protein
MIGKPLIPGDFDDDEDVDQGDFGFLQSCLSGEAIFIPPGCEASDLDADLDVDAADVAMFLSCMGGSGHPAACLD